MSPEEALLIKELASKFAEATMMLEWALRRKPEDLGRALLLRDEAREALHVVIDSMIEREDDGS